MGAHLAKLYQSAPNPEKDKDNEEPKEEVPSSSDSKEPNTEPAPIKNKEINILLMGCTGVGKSTCINSIANYLTFSDIKTAEVEAPVVLIRSQFNVRDRNNVTHQISIGPDDNNECLDTGESATQEVKTYVFPIRSGDQDQLTVRIIDTPGMGDTRGIEKDDENSENILSYISSLEELHAICFLLKPNESRSTVYFKYCMSQILSRLEKSASENILFVFTNSRSSDYGPGETMSILRKAVKDIESKPPYCKIPLEKNVFFLENEAFKYLEAVKHGVKFTTMHTKTMYASWKNSTEECWKLVRYVLGDGTQAPIKPHYVKNTSAINEARRLINHLTQPLADISQLINQNVALLDRHKQNLDVDKNSVEELKKKLYMPVVALEVIELPMPVTICTKLGCAEVYKVGDKNSWHYKQRCHDPCYLNNVPKEVVGSPELLNCAAMTGKGECRECGCRYSVHMHVYYLTETKEVREVDSNVQQNIHSKESIIQNAEQILNAMEIKKAELESEHEIVVTTCAKFAHFLQNNAITPYNDVYLEYINYLIDRERSLGNLCDMDTVHYLQNLLCRYKEMKKSFDDICQLNVKEEYKGGVVTAEEVHECIKHLFALKHNGQKIRELYDCQINSRRREFNNMEYIHNLNYFKKESRKKKNTKKQNKKINSQNYSMGSTSYGPSTFQSGQSSSYYGNYPSVGNAGTVSSQNYSMGPSSYAPSKFPSNQSSSYYGSQSALDPINYPPLRGDGQFQPNSPSAEYTETVVGFDDYSSGDLTQEEIQRLIAMSLEVVEDSNNLWENNEQPKPNKGEDGIHDSSEN